MQPERTVVCRLINLILITGLIVLPQATLSTARASTFVASLSGSAATQQDGWTALKTEDGILFIWNRPGLGFTLSVKGNDVRPLEGGPNIFFSVDGLVLQIQSLPISDFAPNARKDKLDNKAILAAHRDWESTFIETELLHKKITVQSSSDKLADGSEVLIWQYELPEGLRNPDAQKQVYTSIVARDFVILLNSVVGQGGSDATVRTFLLSNLATLRFGADPIDVSKVQEAIRKGQRPQ